MAVTAIPETTRDPAAGLDATQPGLPPSHHVVHDLAALASALVSELATAAHLKPHGGSLDAFLMAAGMNQIVEDYLHRDPLSLRKAARHLAQLGLPGSGSAARICRQAGIVIQGIRPQSWERRLVAWQAELAGVVQALADDVTNGAGTDRADHLLHRASSLTNRLAHFPPALVHSVMRLPACFLNFDQQPADCGQLAAAFAERWPARDTPLIVVGMRTSGSYLAPLLAAFLRGQEYRTVEAITWRPGQPWLAGERQKLIAMMRAGGMALVTDDPPTSGATLAGAARALLRIGFARASVVLIFALFDSPPAWPWARTLQSYEVIALPWDRWAIRERLRPEAVQAVLADLLVGRTIDLASSGNTPARVAVSAVSQVDRLPLAGPVDLRAQRALRRGFRARALYRVRLVEHATGREFDHHVYAKGTGLGYLGQHSLATAERLAEFFPQTYGLRDGVLYRAWLPEENRISRLRHQPSGVAARMASYVAARSGALAVPEDLSQRLLGRDALWECGGQLLSPAFGRAAPLVRPLLRRSFRHLLRVSSPSVIDGSMSGSNWFVPTSAPEGSDPALLKVDFDEGAFQGGAVHSYDAAFDLACAALDYESPDGAGSEFGDALRAAYASLGTEPVEPERWALHQLLQLRARRWLHLYEHRLTQASAQSGTAQNEALVVQALGPMAREMSRIHERYFRDRFFSDVEAPSHGPICAVDVDGVLETPWLGFPAITPAGALALRALARHGYRVVLATGRCIDEVQERCAAYGLAGGVAEYGAVIYNRHSGKARPLLSAVDETALSELRGILQGIEGVYLDPAHQHAVRAYRIQEDRRRGLDPETIEWALGKSDARQRLQAVPGGAQTDFITGAFNKGTGLRALAEDLNGAGPRRSSGPLVAMAVGDTASDLPMFEQTARAFAPANADAAVRRAGATGLLRLKILRRRHQAGLLLAAAAVIGHHPGRCPRCQPPPLSGDAELLVRLLGAQDLGRWGKLQRALLLAGGRPGRDERSPERGSHGFAETAIGPAKGMAR